MVVVCHAPMQSSCLVPFNCDTAGCRVMFPPGREAVAAVEGKRLRRMRSSEVTGVREEGLAVLCRRRPEVLRLLLNSEKERERARTTRQWLRCHHGVFVVNVDTLPPYTRTMVDCNSAYLSHKTFYICFFFK